MIEPRHETLVSRDLLRRALAEREAQEQSFAGLPYVRFSDDYHGVSRGTVILEDGRTVPPFPSIARIFALERGIEKCCPQRFHAEEKLDGYNVRVVCAGGRLLPFTRGGFVCPFTEDRLRDLGDFDPLFDEDPDLVLCGELVGPESPYMDTPSPRALHDVRLFAFDLMRLDRAGPLPLAERDERLQRFGIETVPYVGWFSPEDVPRIRSEVERLDAEGAEGIIFKPEAEGLRVKYVTPSVNVADIVSDATLLAELPPEFFLGRLLRVAMSLEELGLANRTAEYEKGIGHALVSGFLPSLREVAKGGKVAKRFRVRLHSDEAADRLMAHLNRASGKVQAREVERHREGEWLHLCFEKTFQESTSRLQNLLDGGYVVD